MRRLRTCARSLAAIVAVSPFAAPRAFATQPRMREQVIGVRPDSVVPRSLTVSSTGRLAYAVQSAAGAAYVVDGVMGRTYTAVSLPSPPDVGFRPGIRFSPDGKRFSYRARKGDRWVMVVDGVEGPPFDALLSDYAGFSPDSRHTVYVGVRHGKARVVLDGVEGAESYDAAPTLPQLVFRGDSLHVYHIARRNGREYVVIDGKEVAEGERVGQPVYHSARNRFACTVAKGGRWSVVVDGVEGKPYRAIDWSPVFSPDGRRVLYVARDSLYHVVVDGVESRGYAQVRTYGFSGDGEHVAFLASDGDKWFWVLDGRPQKSYDWIDVGYTPSFSPDGTRLTYVAREGRPTVVRENDSYRVVDGGKYFLVIGSWESERFDAVSMPSYFRSDGRVVYSARRGGKAYVGVDSALTAFDEVGWIYPTEDGRVVFPARRGRSWHVVIDRVLSAPYPEPIRLMAVSRDAPRVAFVAGRAGKQFVVVDGAEGQPYDSVSHLGVSSDGRRVLYHAKRRGMWVVVADGIESPEYEELLRAPYPFAYARPRDAVPESVVVIGRRGRTDFRLTVDWARR